MAYSGSANFAIWAYSTRSTDLLVNEIGAHEGRVRWPSGEVVVLDVVADGPWQLRLE